MLTVIVIQGEFAKWKGIVSDNSNTSEQDRRHNSFDASSATIVKEWAMTRLQ